ncbi:efflux transporter periplasmic adaptor subunit, partial [Escherichia coli]
MTTQVNIVLSEAKDALVVPSTALGAKDAQGRYTVRVLDAQGLAQERQVRTGINTNAQVQIVEGLKAGERVVTGTAVPGTADS